MSYLQSEKKRKEKYIDNYLDLAWGLKKLWNMKVTLIIIVLGALGTVSKRKIGKETRKIGNQRKNHDNPEYTIAERGQNTGKSPGDLRRRIHSEPSKRPPAITGVKNSQGHLISAKRLDPVLINKKKKKENITNRGVCHPSRSQSKIKRK